MTTHRALARSGNPLLGHSVYGHRRRRCLAGPIENAADDYVTYPSTRPFPIFSEFHCRLPVPSVTTDYKHIHSDDLKRRLAPFNAYQHHFDPAVRPPATPQWRPDLSSRSDPCGQPFPGRSPLRGQSLTELVPDFTRRKARRLKMPRQPRAQSLLRRRRRLRSSRRR